jgi:hypothetical protein
MKKQLFIFIVLGLCAGTAYAQTPVSKDSINSLIEILKSYAQRDGFNGKTDWIVTPQSREDPHLYYYSGKDKDVVEHKYNPWGDGVEEGYAIWENPFTGKIKGDWVEERNFKWDGDIKIYRWKDGCADVYEYFSTALLIVFYAYPSMNENRRVKLAGVDIDKLAFTTTVAFKTKRINYESKAREIIVAKRRKKEKLEAEKRQVAEAENFKLYGHKDGPEAAEAERRAPRIKEVIDHPKDEAQSKFSRLMTSDKVKAKNEYYALKLRKELTESGWSNLEPLTSDELIYLSLYEDYINSKLE